MIIRLAGAARFMISVGGASTLMFSGLAVSEVQPAEGKPDTGEQVLEVAGISANPGDDDPRVLYILPWQPASVPDHPRVELSRQAAELMQPISSEMLENHRRFRQTLNPLMLEPGLPAPDQP